MFRIISSVFVLALTLTSTAFSQDAGAIRRATAVCQAMSNDAQRLACMDGVAAMLGQDSFAAAPGMVTIPAGRFSMGGNNGDEQPVHSVTITSFQISSTEVTFEQWDAYADGAGGYKPNDQGWGRGNRPVINVSWNDIQGYIAWLNEQSNGNYRLPTEAEWEYAARARATTEYSWGDVIGVNRANCAGCGGQWDGNQTAPVASFAPIAFGLYDMHGNVWEWVQDCYAGNYNNAPNDGSAYERGDCRLRITRGGGWDNNPQFLRSAYRPLNVPSNRYFNAGFRLAQDL